MSLKIIVVGHYLIRLHWDGIPRNPLMRSIVVEVARFRGAKLIVIPTLIIMGVD